MNKILLILLAIFAVIGGFVVYFKIVGWVIDIFQEAKIKEKKIEMTAIVISILALGLAVTSLIISLTH